MSETKRLNWIDIVRGGAILLVIIGHSGCPTILYNVIYSFHMPLFFIISGYLFNYKKWHEYGYKRLIISRFKSYLIPYFLLCFINIILNLVLEFLKNGINNDTINQIKQWIFGILYVYPSVEYMPNCTPLWFLVALFLSSTILYAVLSIGNKIYQRLCVALIIIADATLYYLIDFQLPWCFGGTLIGVCCMYLGYILKNIDFQNKFMKKTNTIIAFFIMTLAGFLAAYINGRVGVGANNLGENPILFWISSICLSLIAMSAAKHYEKQLNFLGFFGQNTILFMGFNYFFNDIPRIIWNKIPGLNQIEYNWCIKSIVCVLCISLLIILWDNLKQKHPRFACVGF